LRTSHALSTIFKKPVTIHYIGHIRANLKTPCLRPRHLKSVYGLARGESSFTTQRVTHPLITNLWVLQQFLNLHFSLFGEAGKMGRVDICCA
jgi:RNA 3'-terminal phosphate cyclase